MRPVSTWNRGAGRRAHRATARRAGGRPTCCRLGWGSAVQPRRRGPCAAAFWASLSFWPRRVPFGFGRFQGGFRRSGIPVPRGGGFASSVEIWREGRPSSRLPRRGQTQGSHAGGLQVYNSAVSGSAFVRVAVGEGRSVCGKELAADSLPRWPHIRRGLAPHQARLGSAFRGASLAILSHRRGGGTSARWGALRRARPPSRRDRWKSCQAPFRGVRIIAHVGK